MRALVFDRVQLAVHVEDDHGAPVMPHQRSLACLGDLLGFQSQWCHGTALNQLALMLPNRRFQGTRTVAPVVARDSRARCACAASASEKICLGSLTIWPALTREKTSSAISSMCSRGWM